MHQLFVTPALTGPGNSGDIDFSLCKARVYTQRCMEIFMVKALPKALFKSWQVNMKILWVVWAWNQKPCGSTALWEQCWDQNMALKVDWTFELIWDPLLTISPNLLFWKQLTVRSLQTK